jgi:hypothetical protein
LTTAESVIGIGSTTSRSAAACFSSAHHLHHLHHGFVLSGADRARAHSGAREIILKGMRPLMKKIVSAVEQFLQAGATWRW